MAPKAKQEEPKEAAPAEELAKRKAEEAPEGEPAAKEAKAEPEVKVEHEKDAEKLSGKALSKGIEFLTPDTTLNVVPTLGGKMLTSITDGGMQYLIASAKANVGVKAGRYAYEVRIVEALTRVDVDHRGQGSWNRGPAPRQLVRLGFGTKDSQLILGEDEEHIGFDSEGNFTANKEKVLNVSKKLTRDQVVTVLLNLDPKSPNKNTVSLFVDGQRASEPQAIPESLVGKPLYPLISYRNVTLQANFGPTLLKELPFKCHMLGGASEKDVEVKAKAEPKDGKYEVVVPVGYPDEGTFDWADKYLAANPHLLELSDRKIHEWAAASGLWKPKGQAWRQSNDKPDYNFGLEGMDNLSVPRILQSITSIIPRHYFIMEVKANLVEADRAHLLKRFGSSKFKKIAHVVMGEPAADFKQMTYEALLKEKQAQSDVAWKAKKTEKERQKMFKAKQKEIQETRRKAEEAKKEAEEAKKKAAETKMEVDGEGEAKAETKKEEGEDVKKEEGATEEKKEEAKEEKKEEAKEEKKEEVKEEAKEEVKEETKDDMEVEEEDDLGDEPPKVELTDEDKKKWFRERSNKDLHWKVLDNNFANFSLPAKPEGFDLVRFEWADEAKSKDYLRQKIVEKKRSTRMDNLVPGQWFQDKIKEWSKLLADLQAKQKTAKAAPKPQKAAEEGSEAAEGEEKAKVEEEDDIFGVKDICDAGNGEPLFKHFTSEDWILVQLRYELWALQVAFKKDVNDPERGGVTETHLPYYYTKYFRKQLIFKLFGVENFVDMTKIVKDTITWNDEGLATELEGEDVAFEQFVKFAEENRRERTRRIDAGDETARLKIQPNALATAPESPAAGHQQSGYGSSVVGGGQWGAAPGITPPRNWQHQPQGGFGGGWKGKGKSKGKGKGKDYN